MSCVLRTSDWSSVVCASDLDDGRAADRGAAVVVDLALDAGRDLLRPGGRRDDGRDADSHQASRDRITKFHVRMSPIGAFCRHAIGARHDLRAPLKPACGTIVTAIVTVQVASRAPLEGESKKPEFTSRSEEHTSELQSL